MIPIHAINLVLTFSTCLRPGSSHANSNFLSLIVSIPRLAHSGLVPKLWRMRTSVPIPNNFTLSNELSFQILVVNYKSF
jgi:hypothetical protein